MSQPNVSIQLQNFDGPLVNQSLAERIARAVIESKYPDNLFVIDGPALTQDEGDRWRVTFRNRLRSGVDAVYVTEAISLTIRKSNGEIVDIS